MKKWIVLVLTLLLLLQSSGISVMADEPVQLGGETATDQSQIARYELVAQNGQLSMYADEKGYFAVRNEKTGYVWYSHPNDTLVDKTTVGANKSNFRSEVIVSYLFMDDTSETSAYSEATVNSSSLQREGWVTSNRIKNGIKVIYDFYTISCRVTVTYTIKGKTLTAKIIGKETLEREAFRKAVKNTATKEQKAVMQDSYITYIWLLPSFGAGNSTDTGFVFVPDGCGAYMDFKPVGQTTELVNIPVYGEEATVDEYNVEKAEFSSRTRNIMANIPAFAIVKNQNGILGEIVTGNEISSVNAYKSGASNAYTGVSPQMDLRIVTQTNIADRQVQSFSNLYKETPDFAVKYRVLDGQDVTVSGLANVLRKDYVKSGLLKKQEYSPALSLKVVGAIDVAAHFLGFPIKKLKSLTSYKQAGEIVDSLKKEGINGIVVNYVGWTNNGIQNKKAVNSAKALRVLGGRSDLDNLANKTDSLYLDADLLTFIKSGNGISKNRNSAKTVFNKAAVLRGFTYSLFIEQPDGKYLVSPKFLEKQAEKYLKSAEKLPKKTAISFNSMSEFCYSDFDAKGGASRIDTVKAYKNILSSSKRTLSAENANLYTFAFVNRIFNAPNASSRQKIYDGEIPFYQLLLHGSVALTSPALNQCISQRSSFLRAVETGCELNFTVMYEDSGAVNSTDYDYLYGTTFNPLKKEIVSLYKEYGKLYRKIYNQEITDYRQIDENAVETVYANGIHILVNYGKTDFTYNSHTAKAQSFTSWED